MPSALTHPAVPLALALAAGARRVPPRLLLVATLASILPDADAIGFHLGIPYEHPFGHRGFSHSLLFALFIAILGTAFAGTLRASRLATFTVLLLATASHGLLDAMTSGGLGIAFFAPLSNHRWFLPWRPIRVSPISIRAFLSGRGFTVLASELRWVWLPLMTLSITLALARRLPAGPPASPASHRNSPPTAGP